jgi:glycosidase
MIFGRIHGMKKVLLLMLISSMFIIGGCSSRKDVQVMNDNYRNYYEIFVRSFYDSDSNGIGDIKGVIEKLDYLKDKEYKTNKDLGVDGIWLMPIMPSPTYHKYDITDYYSIDPEYGTMEDFQELIKKAHERGIKVIIDLVVNHSSSKHPWFLSAKKSLEIEPCGKEVCTYPELCREHNKYVKYYNFSKEKKSGYQSKEMPAGWYYECVFSDNMPDLNLDNLEVVKEIEDIGKFWIDKGVDGYRLDAVTSYYTGNTTKNVAFLSTFNEKMKSYKKDIYMVGEAWTEANTLSEYYKSGIDSFFNFPYADATGKLVTTIRNRDGAAFSKSLEAWQNKIREIDQKAIDAPFISNHDMGRSAGFLAKNLASKKMGASLYLMAPGNSFIYYGEEIGMLGSGKDENKRLPLLWSTTDKKGMTNAPPNANYTAAIETGVMEQQEDKNSLLQFYKQAIKIKNENPEIQRGVLTSIDVGDHTICAYSLQYENSKVYVIHNLSEKEVNVKLSSKDYGKLKLIGELITNGEKLNLKDNNLKMPSMSTAILK